MGEISDPLTLDAEALEVGLVPGIGGSMVPLRRRGVDLTRRLSDQ